MIAKEFYTKLVGIYLANKDKELVIGFTEQWKGINTIIYDEDKDKILIIIKDLNDIENYNTKSILNIIKDYEKSKFNKEIVVYNKNKYYKIVNIHLDIDDCIVIDIEE